MKFIKYLMAASAMMLASANASAAIEDISSSINDAISPIVNPFVNFVFATLPGSESLFGYPMPWIVLWLVVAATVFTIYFGFIQFRGVGHSISIVKGDYLDPKDAGEVTPFQALCTALSGTVGLGNIAGVGVAVAIGGPGATFWMILAGLLGMASKFTECILGVHYRNEYADGTVSGGPMYYLSKGLAERGMTGLGKFLGIAFSIACVLGALGGGNMFQANQAATQLNDLTGIPPLVTGLVLAVLVFIVIIGGVKSIAKVTDKIVPFMAAIYVGSALIIILLNIGQVGAAFDAIFAGAFTGAGVAGGMVGALIQGFKRAAFSNEAGVGSAAIAHAAVQTKHPATEGYVALLEPFIDTVVICTMTSLVIIITGSWIPEGQEGFLSGIQLTSKAFESSWGGFGVILAIAAVLFAFSTMISWSYYGVKAWTYMFGEGKGTETIFKVIFCVFVVIGSAMSLGPVIDFSDAAIFTMAVFNIIGLYLLMPKVKELVTDYQAKLAAGEIRKIK
ncbi:alanine/glycine:cation symporter family protein [Gammaproteobacteria bacterium]|nr:alanine/glycine:cation symporter family protein [Gammaproteobacteria bacterium]